MPLGLMTGLGAALSWGTLDIFSALASRRIGSLRVTTGMQIVGASLVVILALATGTAFPADPYVIVGGALVGLAGAGAYLSYFTGLRIGPISVDRSKGIRPEANTECSTPSITRLKAASMTPRTG